MTWLPCPHAQPRRPGSRSNSELRPKSAEAEEPHPRVNKFDQTKPIASNKQQGKSSYINSLGPHSVVPRDPLQPSRLASPAAPTKQPARRSGTPRRPETTVHNRPPTIWPNKAIATEGNDRNQLYINNLQSPEQEEPDPDDPDGPHPKMTTQFRGAGTILDGFSRLRPLWRESRSGLAVRFPRWRATRALPSRGKPCGLSYPPRRPSPHACRPRW